MQASVYIATSLDGFIARPDGGLDWLPGADGSGDTGEDYGYQAFMESVELLVMGRHTYEKVLTFGDWPYDKPVVVLSSKAIALPENHKAPVEQMSGSPKEIIDRLTRRGVRHVYVDGGTTIQRFLRAGLIQRLIITRIPVLIGSGLPLFGPLEADIALQHLETRSTASGMVQSEYRVVG